jgi:hypothetical protein
MAESASPEMVDRIKQVYEFWNCGEPDLMVDEYAEDGELDFSRVFTGMPAFGGHESLRRQIEEFWETWEGVRMDPLDVWDIASGWTRSTFGTSVGADSWLTSASGERAGEAAWR